MRSLTSGIAGLWLMFSLLGCSGSGAPTSVTAPAETHDSSATLPPGAPALLGLANIQLRWAGDTPQVTVTPVREATLLGDNYALDASRYFQGSLCGNCLQVSGFRLVNPTTLDLTFTLKHPFPLPPATPTPQQRLDLHIFDVAGLLLSPEGGPLFPGAGLRIAQPILLNAEGFSGTFDPVLERIFPTPNVDLHPYRLFGADFTAGNFAPGNPNGFADLRAPVGHSVLPQGGEASQTYRLLLGSAPTSREFGADLLLAITANWGQGSTNQPGTEFLQRGNPAYFLPEFNQKAAVAITATLRNNLLKAADPSSTADLDLTITDWQWGAMVDPGFPNPAQLDRLALPSAPAEIYVEIPGITTTPISIDPGLGSGAGPQRDFTYSFTNAAAAPEGTYLGLVTVIDSHSNAFGIAQDDPQPMFLGQLATYQVFVVTVGPAGTGGPFRPSVLVSDRAPLNGVGHLNVNMPELVTDGSDFFLAYQGPNDEAVVARSTTGGASFPNFEILQAEADAFLDPAVGLGDFGNDVHVLLASPDEFGMFDLYSEDNGGSWSELLTVHDSAGAFYDSQAITTGAGNPVAVFGVIRGAGPTLELVLASARWTGSAWVEGAYLSDLRPTSGSPTLIRLDEAPMVYRLSNGHVIAIFVSNERDINTDGEDFALEPVSVRSLDDGATWQDWTALRGTGDPEITYDTIATAQLGDTLFVLELTDESALTLQRSTDEGLNWTLRTLPVELTSARTGLLELAGRGGRLAVVWSPLGGGNATLLTSTSLDQGLTWTPAIPCDDDPANLADLRAASAVITGDGLLHVAFLDNRLGASAWRWRMVSETAG